MSREVHFDPSLPPDAEDEGVKFTLHWFDCNVAKKPDRLAALSIRELLRFREALTQEHRMRMVYDPKLLMTHFGCLSVIRCELERRSETDTDAP